MALSHARKGEPWPTAVDLFCGCGAATAGLKSARFKIIAAVDNDPVACKTYGANHPTVRLIAEDITQIDPWELKNTLLAPRSLDLMVVCAPCQPFSSQLRCPEDDARANLILESIRFAKALSPSMILLENVPGLVAARFQTLLRTLERGLKAHGYRFRAHKQINAADFGVPQRRVRSILLATKGHIPPKLPTEDPAAPLATVRSAIADLRPLLSGEEDPNDRLHFARNHRQVAIERLKHIPKDGGSRESLPSRLELNCHKGNTGHPDVYGRMSWDMVAPTLTTGCTDLTRGRFAHPRDDRALTLREAARLQTFPDEYRFHGSAKAIAAQIGNAVPVRLIAHLARELRQYLGRDRK